MIRAGRKGLWRRHKKFAKGDNDEPMIQHSLINTKIDEVKYDMLDDYYEQRKITSAGEKLE